MCQKLAARAPTRNCIRWGEKFDIKGIARLLWLAERTVIIEVGGGYLWCPPMMLTEFDLNCETILIVVWGVKSNPSMELDIQSTSNFPQFFHQWETLLYLSEFIYFELYLSLYFNLSILLFSFQLYLIYDCCFLTT